MKQDETKNDVNSFKCQQCGGCCTSRGDIIVAPMDLLRYCKFFNLSPREFLKKYTYLECRYKQLPNVYLLSKGDILERCIFFKVGKGCTINPVKPAVCYLYPLDAMDDLLLGHGPITVNDINCNNAKRLQSLSQEELIEYINISSSGRYLTEKPFIKRFFDLSVAIDSAFQKHQPRRNEKNYLQQYISKFLKDFYLNLDVKDDNYLEKKFDEWEGIVCFI
ncbi:MAG: YkgJ family cysteine cluster protein [Clostridia bacterium]|nr:YkgJ family cysteine cluster protein [Clostridia bacterium]